MGIKQWGRFFWDPTARGWGVNGGGAARMFNGTLMQSWEAL